MFRIGLVMVIGGGVLGFIAYQENALAAGASESPQAISLQQLIARGPAGNPNVLLSGFVPCDNYICQSRENNPDHWDKVWVPVVPSESVKGGLEQKIAPPSVEALIVTSNAKNEEQLILLFQSHKLQGMVTNKIASLGTKEQKLLAEAYPQTDFAKCLIIEIGRQPSSSAEILAFYGGATALILIGGSLMFAGWQRGKY